MKSVRTPATLGRVPNKPRTQHRSVRVDDDDWDGAEAATAAMGTDRAKVINQFLRWYLRRPGAVLPLRPDAPVTPRRQVAGAAPDGG